MNSLNNDFKSAAQESGYNVRMLKTSISLMKIYWLTSQRRIIQWVFDDNREVGEIKRFDLSFGGYVVVKLKNINEKESLMDEVRDEITMSFK